MAGESFVVERETDEVARAALLEHNDALAVESDSVMVVVAARASDYAAFDAVGVAFLGVAADAEFLVAVAGHDCFA